MLACCAGAVEEQAGLVSGSACGVDAETVQADGGRTGDADLHASAGRVRRQRVNVFTDASTQNHLRLRSSRRLRRITLLPPYQDMGGLTELESAIPGFDLSVKKIVQIVEFSLFLTR